MASQGFGGCLLRCHFLFFLPKMTAKREPIPGKFVDLLNNGLFHITEDALRSLESYSKREETLLLTFSDHPSIEIPFKS